VRRTLCSLALVWLLATNNAAMATTCWRPTVEEHVRSADAVFSGRVFAVQGQPLDSYPCSRDWDHLPCDHMAVAEILVDELYKGPPGDQQRVHFYWDNAAAFGWGFRPGQEVVIFARMDHLGELNVDYCTQIPFYGDDMREEYRSFLAGMLAGRDEREQEMASTEDPPAAWFQAGLSLASYEHDVGNPFGALAVYERLWAASRGRMDGWRLDSVLSPALKAAVAAIQARQYARALPFVLALRDGGHPGTLAHTIESYIRLRSGEDSSMVEFDRWTEGGTAAMGGVLLTDYIPTVDRGVAVLTGSIMHDLRSFESEFSGSLFLDVVIVDVDFGDADLGGSIFNRVAFSQSDFFVAELSDAEITDSWIVDASVQSSTLEDIAISRSEIQNTSFVDSDLSDARIHSTELSNVDFSRSILEGTDFSGSWFKDVSFADAVLQDADFAMTGGSASFAGADLADASFANAMLDGFTFKGHAGDERPAVLEGARFEGSEILLANFYDTANPRRSADLAAADLTGAVFLCPRSFGADQDAAVLEQIFRELDPATRGATVEEDCPR
jgi:uncharacterized protein YjbI with pentapeptide repeats